MEHKKKEKKDRSSLDNRPPWNNDTHIDGYDDVDENGRYRKRYTPTIKTTTDQEELNRSWSNSLRGGFHDQQQRKAD